MDIFRGPVSYCQTKVYQKVKIQILGQLKKSNIRIFNCFFISLKFVILIPYLLLPANAQTITPTVTPENPTVLPTPQPLPEPQTLPPLEELFLTPEQIRAIPQPSLEQIPGKITVTQFDVIGNNEVDSSQCFVFLQYLTISSRGNIPN